MIAFIIRLVATAIVLAARLVTLVLTALYRAWQRRRRQPEQASSPTPQAAAHSALPARSPSRWSRRRRPRPALPVRPIY